MEHRWGERVRVDIPIRVILHPFSVRNARLADFSVSGACIKADFDLRVLSRIKVAIELPHRSKHEAPTVGAYVARRLKDNIGIEWCEFAPPAVSRLLQTVAARPHTRLRKPEPAATVAVSRLSAPLLKHGS